VDLVGIEPKTSSMPWKRAPSCATGPLGIAMIQFSLSLGVASNSTRHSNSNKICWQNTRHKRSPMLNSRNSLVCSLLSLIAVVAPVTALAQDLPPVAYSSVSELSGILSQLQQTAQKMQDDLGKTRIDKWKTDAATKKQSLGNVQSIQRNLQSSLPETITTLSNSPEDLGASFKLYRNLDALYDVFGSVVESAGAFGSKDEFQNLGNDMNGLESARRSFAERMQKLASNKEDELTHLRAQVKTLSAAPPPPPKKIVVDDTEPPKKPATKKKVAKPKTPATTTGTPPSAPPQ
jgi:hypothetical protein